VKFGRLERINLAPQQTCHDERRLAAMHAGFVWGDVITVPLEHRFDPSVMVKVRVFGQRAIHVKQHTLNVLEDYRFVIHA
jgi:hypothetical protein